ncbi:hypothetical protein A2U01_0068802, partial [Trifolium medium]|nr:hypothetical protein [Trifolium medium]
RRGLGASGHSRSSQQSSGYCHDKLVGRGIARWASRG